MSAGFAGADPLPEGTVIDSPATLTFTNVAGVRSTVAANALPLTSTRLHTNAVVELFRFAADTPPDVSLPVGPAACRSSDGSIITPPPPTLANGEPLPTAGPIPLRRAETFHRGEPLFVRVSDADQNLDPDAVETLAVELSSVLGDTEALLLTESAANSGEFTGLIQSVATTSQNGNCQLSVAKNMAVTLAYVDSFDASDATDISVHIDPLGRVFDSATGAPTNGVTITLIDAATGTPATVLGDDAVSVFPATIQTGSTVTDAGGNTYEFAAGEYRFPYVEPGDYRLRIEPPEGYAAPSSVADEALQNLAGAPWQLSAASRGEVFSVDPGPGFLADIPVDPVSKTLFVTKVSGTARAAIGDFAQFTLSVTNTGAVLSARDIRLQDRLPPGFRYRPGSTRLNSQPAADPKISPDGRTLTWQINNLAAGEKVSLRYVVAIGAGTPGGDRVNTAWAESAGAGKSNLASATVRIEEDIIQSRSAVEGIVQVGTCKHAGDENVPATGLPGIRLFMEDGRYVVTDTNGRYHFNGVAPGVHVLRIDLATLPAEYELLACGSKNPTHSRFVDISGGKLWRENFTVRRKAAMDTSDPEAIEAGRSAPRPPELHPPPRFELTADVFASAPAGNGWLWPPPDLQLEGASTPIAIHHDASLTARAFVNGKPVHKTKFAGRFPRNDGVAVSYWMGADLAVGPNRLAVELRDADGQLIETLERELHFGGVPVRATFVEELSWLTADGRHTPFLAVRFFDRWNRPARPGSQGRFQVSPPFAVAQDKQQLLRDRLLALAPRETLYTVRDDGLAYIKLMPTTDTGEINLQFEFAEEHHQELSAWMHASARDWILVGLAEGTAAYRRLRGNLEMSREPDQQEGFWNDGRIAFFAQGRITGDTLLTLAYDSDKQRDSLTEGFAREIDPDAYFTVYGDASIARQAAPSREKLYVKLERRQFHALFGDFDTGIDTIELARYQRRLTGLKAEYKGENMSFTVFAAESPLAFVRDEIPGDGTSGLYRLSRRRIVAHSERIWLETHDRIHSERIHNRRELTRHVDYTIDYLAGTIHFSRPVPSRDADLNPIMVVAEYETAGDTDTRVAGGRAAVHFLDDRIEIGATLVDEDAGIMTGQHAGIDARLDISDNTRLATEYASSSSVHGLDDRKGDAWLTEIEHRSEKVAARAYARQQAIGYGLGNQQASEAGTRKSGASVQFEFMPDFTAEAEIFRHESTVSSAQRDLAKAGVRWNRMLDISSGLRAIREQSAGETTRAEQLFLGASRAFLAGDLRVFGNIDKDLGTAETLWPARRLLGIDYRVLAETTLFAEQEHAASQAGETDILRAGVRAQPWSRATVHSGMEQHTQGDEPRTFATAGLMQGVELSEGWMLEFGIDRKQTIDGASASATPLPDLFGPAPESGAEDFTAVTLGTTYRSERWSGMSRIERLRSDAEDRRSFAAGWYRDMDDGKAVSLTAHVYDTVRNDGNREKLEDIALGLAWRPENHRLHFLERFEVVRERRGLEHAGIATEKLISNLHANILFNRARQLALSYGAKYVRTDFDSTEYAGFTDLVGAEYRQGFAARWDVGIHAMRLASHDSGTRSYAYGSSVGFSFTENLWLSVGYNVDGFFDRDFDMADFATEGPFIRFRMKFDETHLKRLAGLWDAPD